MRKQNGFTMIELIMVLVVLGILATYSIPRLNRDTRAEAMNHMLSMIRYTQNLALHDNKQLDNNSSWQLRFWRFEIKKCGHNTGLYYRIGSDEDMKGVLSQSESAIDPSNGKYLYWNTNDCPKSAIPAHISPNIFITQKYGINEVDFKKCKIMQDGVKKDSSIRHVAFDSFGRYYKLSKSYNKANPIYNGIGVGDCKIEFKFEDSSIKPFTIIINKETGFAYLQERPNL